MNGTALWSSQIFPPRSHGSGAAPLAELIVSGHDGHVVEMTAVERDLLFAWIDTNGLYYGTWNRTASGCAIAGWNEMRTELTAEMQAAGCLECHGEADKLLYFENDWVNLERPGQSRLLRAPLDASASELGLAWCRSRKVTRDRQRIHLLRNGYAHAVQPPEAFARHELVKPDRSGEPHVSFRSANDPHYQNMLSIIQQAREAALAAPRVDMPGAHIQPGLCRFFVPPPVPETPLAVSTRVDGQGAVRLAWEYSADTIGLEFELHRSTVERFQPDAGTLIARTVLDHYVDASPPSGKHYYALIPVSDGQPGQTTYADVAVP